MSKCVSTKFRKGDPVVLCGTEDPRDKGSQAVVIKVRGRNKWTKFSEPEYRVQLPSGIRVVRESNLAPVPASPKPNGQAQGRAAATKTALQTPPIPAAARGPVHTTQLVTVQAPATAKPAGGEWPKPPIKVTTYHRPGASRSG